MKNYSNNKNPRFKIGPVMQKALLLLEGGLVLGLTRRPDSYFKILKKISKEWRKISERALKNAIRKLYQSKLIGCKENKDGTVSMILTDAGKKKIIKFNLDFMEIKKPKQWDRLWRLVIFDIPEKKRQGRRALAEKLKELGFYPVQKSVFIHPYECQDEINFITEIFNLRPYTRLFTVKETDIELDLKTRFKL
ncbi:MAG: CRISPR-associated endonuclease Cas2 [Candidatus Nealsonbacteria bacterium RIFCSPLOWO2_01_FULL_43_32]|uniref:CRISPR-associated endonuclease Cas2 n=1 Tax=Candidatus Nealsonbacteria bacterium RIFCSPLOWO2_01_FULL_43_32 TaxID=1801672 RepID=A0A1G2EF97_9BACT|nr:MAG: CRISPR-associated endonuclease Cas2 [Candidatus Nealsonbacteria bacterium RIFCSPLOWO2_01_FULL_43_32]